MFRLSTLALAAGLLLTAVAATPPNMPAGGQPEPGGPPNPGMPPSGPSQGMQPSNTPSPNPQMLAQAKSWFAQLQAGKIDRSQLAPGMASSLTDEQVTNVSTQIKSLGTPVTFEQQQTMTQNGVNYAVYLLTFGDSKKLNFIFAVDGQGKVAGLRLQPAP